MDSRFMILEIIGIGAALLVSISLCMTHIKRLRVINLMGSLVFIIYGFLIAAPSVIILNFFSAGVNIFYLLKMRNETGRPDTFDILFVNSGDDEHVRRFILFHQDDIIRFFPSFDPDPQTGSLKGAECCFVLRETLPVSLVAYRRGEDEEDNEIHIILDYAVPAYRDFKNAQFFFNSAVSRLVNPGTVFLAESKVPKHTAYLKKIGFTEIRREGTTAYFRRAV